MAARRYAKAIFGFIVPLAGALLVALSSRSPGADSITGAELLVAVLTAIVSGGTVYAVPNRPPKGQLPRADISEQDKFDAGMTALEVVLLVAAILVIICAVIWLASTL